MIGNFQTLIPDFPAYVALLGSNIALPCNVTPLSPGDSVSLILWYRNESVKPLYRVDARDVSALDKAQHSQDDGLQSRLVFHINYPLGYLQIKPIVEGDGGEYRQVECRAKRKCVDGQSVSQLIERQSLFFLLTALLFY